MKPEKPPFIELVGTNQKIEELDSLMLQGHKEFLAARTKVFTTETFPEHTREILYKEIVTNEQVWSNKVMVHLQERGFPAYYQFHFMERSDKSLAYMNIPVKISNALGRWSARLENLEEILFKLEETERLEVRKEIAKIESQADSLYQITYSEHSREIRVNNILIAKPDFESENERFFTYVFSNPGQALEVKKIEEHYKTKFNKRVSDILRDLRFNGKLRSVFFPVVTQEKVMFINPITKQYAIQHELPSIDLGNSSGDTKRTK